jgi:succinate-semialdehyde dehydrogenase/glutarate-semialdehyde dehydrogenase
MGSASSWVRSFASVRAFRAQREWAQASFGERAAVLRRVAAALRDAARRLGPTIALEMGKPLTQAGAEFEKSAWV